MWKQYQTKFNSFSKKNTAVLGTSHIIRKVLQSETRRLSGGVHHWLNRRTTREKKTCDKRTTTNNNNNNNNNSFFILTC
jgi:hypothetical protein